MLLLPSDQKSTHSKLALIGFLYAQMMKILKIKTHFAGLGAIRLKVKGFCTQIKAISDMVRMGWVGYLLLRF